MKASSGESRARNWPARRRSSSSSSASRWTPSASTRSECERLRTERRSSPVDERSVELFADEREDAELADLAGAQLVEPAEALPHALARFERSEREARRGVLAKAHLEDGVH